MKKKEKKGLADVLRVIKCSVDSSAGMRSGWKKSQDIQRHIVTSHFKIFVKAVKTPRHNLQALYQNIYML